MLHRQFPYSESQQQGLLALSVRYGLIETLILVHTGKAVKDDLDFCRQEEKRVEDSFGSLYAQRDSISTLQVNERVGSCLPFGNDLGSEL